MTETTINIKLYDNEKSEYPIITIWASKVDEFKTLLKIYQENDDYNLDGFISSLKCFDWFVDVVDYDIEVFF